jgi:hypothetical protein
MYNAIGQCSICKKEFTSMHVEFDPGEIIYVCPYCMEKTKDNFVWICTNCGKSFFRPRQMVLERLEASGIDNASLLGEGMHLITGIDMCISCNPQAILDYVFTEEPEEEEALCNPS